MIRKAGTLTGADLGHSVTEPREGRKKPRTGSISSVRHFVHITADKKPVRENCTVVLVQIPNAKGPDYREFGPWPSTTEIEVSGNG